MQMPSEPWLIALLGNIGHTPRLNLPLVHRSCTRRIVAGLVLTVCRDTCKLCHYLNDKATWFPNKEYYKTYVYPSCLRMADDSVLNERLFGNFENPANTLTNLSMSTTA
jgi:hypothetical protein